MPTPSDIQLPMLRHASKQVRDAGMLEASDCIDWAICKILSRDRDTEMVNWLERQDGGGVFSDDCGHWAVSSGGFQPLVDSEPISGVFVYDAEAKDWKDSLREAIADAMAEEEYVK